MKDEIIKTLKEQLALLAKASKDTTYANDLKVMSDSMVSISSLLLAICE